MIFVIIKNNFSIFFLELSSEKNCQNYFKFPLVSPSDIFNVWSVHTIEYVWSVHTISTSTSWWWLWGLPMGLFLIWWCLVLCRLWCSLPMRCIGWLFIISFLMRELFAVVLQLMSKIHMHAERLRRPMHATVWSLISTKCSLLVEWIIRNSWLGPIPTIFLSHSALLVTRLYLDDL